jgi:hypothetical protein
MDLKACDDTILVQMHITAMATMHCAMRLFCNTANDNGNWSFATVVFLMSMLCETSHNSRVGDKLQIYLISSPGQCRAGKR